ncbi:MAG: MT-A70 family methyltransferase [Myxococcota bacterium]
MSAQLQLLGSPGRFGAIAADPPWNESGGGKIKRGADRHYPLLKTEAIPGVMRRSGVFDPLPNAHLYLWVTNSFLPDGMWVMRTLGFRYVTNLVWVKDRAGLGQYFRGRHELCLFGVNGTGLEACTDARDIDTVIEAPRGRHSAKPTSFHERVEARSVGPYCEIFARGAARPGWTIWGNEVS